MSALASLCRAYDRLKDAPPFGFSAEKIGFCISLNADGSVAHVIDLRDTSGKKPRPRIMLVPQPVKRTAGIRPNTFWDKSSYVLGVTAGDGKRTADEHTAFVQHHVDLLSHTDDPGLKALLTFLKDWQEKDFTARGWSEEMQDANIVFALESDRPNNIFLHDRPAAKEIWANAIGGDGADPVVCLISGKSAPAARLHPSVKGVWGAQSSGAALVSFNLDAFASYGHEQGMNAPVSELAAFKYTTVLNAFLAPNSGLRIQIGDASTVFWAEASDVAPDAECLFSSYIDPSDDEDDAARRIAVQLARIRKGEPLAEVAPRMENVRFFVLGLAPNAARLSVRFYWEDDFGTLTKNYQRYVKELRIDPPPQDPFPPLWRYLRETAVLKKSENVAPNLAGEWTRAILSGAPYPMTLLASVLTRIRADGDVNALRAGLLKAVLIRNFNREVPVALDPENRDRGYVLGRLFALYELAQSAALGSKVNATIKDKFYGAASAQPGKVFPMLEKNSANHLSKVGKASPGRRVNLEKQIGSVMDQMRPDENPFPAMLSAQEQALFGLGYYHQRNEAFKKHENTADAASGETEA